MIILKEQIEPQEIKFIPRDYFANILVLRNETTNEVVTLTPDFVVDSYYLKCNVSLDLKENTFYNLTILKNRFLLTADNSIQTVDSDLLTADMNSFIDEELVIYKDKIFCTNQIKEDYTVNKNKYVSNDTNNEYKIYE